MEDGHVTTLIMDKDDQTRLDERDSPQKMMSYGGSHDDIHSLMAPGDVLAVRAFGHGRLKKIGAHGGFMNHVLLVTEHPRSIRHDTPEAQWFSPLWPAGDVPELWLVRAMESTRTQRGLYEAEMIFFIDERTGQLILLGELNGRLQLGVIKEPEILEIWQSPPEQRELLRTDIVKQVLDDMRNEMGEMNWSISTALRAALKSAVIPSSKDPAKVMEEIQACWRKEPICTSVIVIFWQRYLWNLADTDSSDGGNPHALTNVVDTILKQMPLKSDRTLPGELLTAMCETGWVVVRNAPDRKLSSDLAKAADQ